MLAARRSEDGSDVVLKLPKPGQRGDRLEQTYSREAEYRQALGQGSVELHRHLGLPLLVSPGAERVALSDLAQSDEPPSVETWLRIARSAARQLKKLHALGVLHRDIHPGNLLWSAASGQVALIDFEHSVQWIRAEAAKADSNRLPSSLPYVAPEATGRMNVGVDERSDLYSLGAALYELLAGQRPFSASEPLELVHQHLTQVPTAPRELRADVPATVSAIVMKLLEKSPNRRYQSARGLECDLDQAQARLDDQDGSSDIELGSNDFADRYRARHDMFGRDRERQALQCALENAARGDRMLFVIAGHSGIGKTTIAHEAREPALLADGIFAEGKCDQFLRLQPYSVWTKALDSVVAQILSRPTTQRMDIRNALLSALGENGSLLTAIVPSLEGLIGVQPPVSELAAREAQNRLGYVFAGFLGQLAAKLPPLVIFLDDLQWVDSASLDLLQALAHSGQIQNLLMICAYRDNEVDPAHPLIQTLKAVHREQGELLETITLSNLTRTDLAQMCASHLNLPHEEAGALAEAVHAKTAGNPFDSHQLLERMADLRILAFDETRSRWVWDADRADALPPTDNVVELLLQRLRELPESAQKMLEIGACIGSDFDPDVLACAAGYSTQQVEQALDEVLKEGLLVRKSAGFRFAHDRVQQAASTLIAPDERMPIHLRIGRQLLKAHDETVPGRTIFDVLSHFEKASDLIDAAQERGRVAELAVDGADRARAASAHDAALRFYRLALSLRGETAWQTDSDGQWRLYLDAIQSEFNNANHDRVERMLEVAVDHAKTPLDRVLLYELECQFAIARNDQNAAIDLALNALELLDIRFAPEPKTLAEQAQILRAAIEGNTGSIEALVELDEMNEPVDLAAMRVMASAAGAAYVMRPALWEVLTLQMVRHTLEHGSSPLAAFAYGFYGVLLASRYGDIEQGYAFGRLSTRLLERRGMEPLQAKIINLFDVFVRHWKEPLRNSLEALPRGLQAGIDYGDFEYGSYNAIQHGKHQVICGCPLDETLEQQDAYMAVIERLKMGYHLDFARIWRQLAINLSGRADKAAVLAGDGYDAAALIPRLLEQSSNFLVFNIHCTQTMLAYFLGRHDEALAAAEEAVSYSDYVSGMAEAAEHNFFHSLSLLASLEPGNALHNRRLLRRVVRNQRQLKVWAEHSPLNFRHKWLLVEAERHRRSSRPHRAREAYDQATRGALDAYYLNDQALATELHAEFELEQGHALLGSSLIREALRLYGCWQAHEKVRQLQRRYAAELKVIAHGDPLLEASYGSSPLSLDVQSALRASLAIAHETDLETLERRLMRILAESAAAQRGVLVLGDDSPSGPRAADQEWSLTAEFDGAGTRALRGALTDTPDLPQTFLAQVIRQRQSLVLDDARSPGPFRGDPYFQNQAVRSALCVPLLHGEDLVGLFYLENRQTSQAFSPKSVQIVEILAAQATVAIEKGRLLATLEQRIERRTRELSRTTQELERAMGSLRSSEERFRLAMRATSEGLFDWNLASGDAYYSPGWKRMLGYADQELEDSMATWWGRVDPVQIDAVRDEAQRQLSDAGENFELECRLRHKEGYAIEAMTRATIVRGEDGTALRLVGSTVDVTAERRAQAAIAHQALHDSLTGLPNRTLLLERLEAARRGLRRNGTRFALHLLDLDRFKQINDTHGHQAGDEALERTTARMLSLMRETDTIARLGGDEFAVVQAEVRRDSDCFAVSDKLVAGIGKPIVLESGATVALGCSIGICLVDDPAIELDAMIRRADLALYRSKNTGRHRATLYSAGLEPSDA